MTDDHRPCKGVLAIALLVGFTFGIPLTGGLILLVPGVVLIARAIRRRNQAAYDEQVRRQKQDDDAAYGRRMRGY